MNMLVPKENQWLFNFRLNHLTEVSLLVLVIFLLIFFGFPWKTIILKADNDNFASTFPIVRRITSVFYFIEFIQYYQSKAKSLWWQQLF